MIEGCLAGPYRELVTPRAEEQQAVATRAAHEWQRRQGSLGFKGSLWVGELE